MIRLAQYGRTWFASYAINGAYLTTGRTKRAALVSGAKLLEDNPAVVHDPARHVEEE